MSMIDVGGRSGSGGLSSEQDSRWNCEVECGAILFAAGMPQEIQEALEEKKKLYGEPPGDLRWFAYKD